MKISVTIPTPLRQLTAQQDTVEVEATSVREMVENLEKQYAGLRERLLDENGQVRRFINIYINGEDIRFLQDIETSLKGGDEVSIVPAIAGG